MLAPAIVSGILIAAHFLRSASYVLAGIGALFPVLLLANRRWATRTVQVLLMLAAVEWLRTLAEIAIQRHAAGEAIARMAFILGAVAAFTLWSAFAAGPKKKS